MGRPSDREMRQRIARHQQERPAHWTTLEHPADPAAALARLDGTVGGAILDCLTTYLSTLLMRRASERAILQNIERLCESIHSLSFPVIIVTNEVGAGVVPAYALGRAFRDLSGFANQIAAASAHQVVSMTAGIPVQIKGPRLTPKELRA